MTTTAEYFGEITQVICGYKNTYKRYRLPNGSILDLPLKSSWTIEDYMAKHYGCKIGKVREAKKMA